MFRGQTLETPLKSDLQSSQRYELLKATQCKRMTGKEAGGPVSGAQRHVTTSLSLI